ncbi:cobalt-precorrin 5A hydrolase [Anaerocolumna sp.]|uniref:cobalt-precorrin 5A hydrolase n=1 Tax=Anaerocolumna sp. TaxID=2041569 RepID=UPI0028AA49A4|nr:cobalt-precorrin 5A hydrolase [Anaerocolumna sp.]
MKLSIISFTSRGLALSLSVQKDMGQEMEVNIYTKYKRLPEVDKAHAKEEGNGKAEYIKENLLTWTGEQFHSENALLFIGASGIAIRAIAPFVKDKLEDPAILVMDEAGRFVIPVLSGHYGGANELARRIADKLGAVAVITTATDVNRLFAVDVFARKNNLVICDRKGIKEVSSAVLAGEKVTIAIAGDYDGKLPEELALISYPAMDKASVIVSPFLEDGEKTDLQLCPKAYILGVGCRRGKSLSEIEEVIGKELLKAGIRRESLAALVSIDRKKEEVGLLEYAKKYHLAYQTFSEEELKNIPGEFTSSSFVQEQVGVDNVCERAAMAACGEGGRLLTKKYPENGITVAIAERKWSVTFDEI